MTKFLSLCP